MAGSETRFALVGPGSVAKKYVEAIKAIENAALCGVVSRTAAKAEAFAKDCDIPGWAASMETLFSQIEIDAVIVATPSGLHSQGVIEAVKFGKHILCEKPLDITLEKIDKMVKACRKAGVKLGCCYQHRTSEYNRLVYEAIQSGRLGKVYIANAFLKNYRTQEYYDSGLWRGTWALDGGGPFMQQAAHTIDLMVWMMGRAKRAIASMGTLAHEIEVEDMGHAIVQYENDAQGVLEASTVVKPGYCNRIEIHGEKGSIILSEEGIVDWQVEGAEKPQLKTAARASGASDPMAISALGHEMIIRDFIEAIEQDREPIVSADSARLSVELILAIYKSARKGRAIEIKG